MTAKKWTVSGAVAASTYVGEFFVETGEDAIRMAYGAADVSVCHQCAQNISDPEVAWLVATCGEEEITDRPDLAADLARVTAERDAAIARAEKAEARAHEAVLELAKERARHDPNPGIVSLSRNLNRVVSERDALGIQLAAQSERLRLAMACVKAGDDVVAAAMLACQSQHMLDVLRHNLNALERRCDDYADTKDALDAVPACEQPTAEGE